MLSRHAEVRCQQRGISKEDIGIIMRYGESRRSAGAELITMTKRACSRVSRQVEEHEYKRLRKRLNAYIVVSDEGVVITAGKRYRRFKNR